MVRRHCCWREASDEEAKAFVREYKAITTGSTGVTIPEMFQSEWIDLIRAQSLNAAGMSTLAMTAKVYNASAVSADPTASWHTEAASINASNPTFAARTMTAQTLVTRSQASLEVSQDSPDFGAQLAAVLARAMAAELDRVSLVGTGTPPEPHGIVGTSGIGTVVTSGSPTSWAGGSSWCENFAGPQCPSGYCDA